MYSCLHTLRERTGHRTGFIVIVWHMCVKECMQGTVRIDPDKHESMLWRDKPGGGVYSGKLG